LVKQCRDADLTVWAIPRFSRQKVDAFNQKTHTLFPVLIDSSGVSAMKVNGVRTDSDFSYGHIKDQGRPIKANDKLREDLTILLPAAAGTRIW